jgi:hypothetical protein
MPRDGGPERGTLLIAALLILALIFAGEWIVTYVRPGSNPWALLPWFGIAALVIVIVGLVVYLAGGRRSGSA